MDIQTSMLIRPAKADATMHATNPFKPNRLSHPYKLDRSISNFRAAGLYFFYFHSNFNKKSV